MAPTCEKCLQLSQEVSELKMRESRLHQIKDDETFLDSICESIRDEENPTSPDPEVHCGPKVVVTDGPGVKNTPVLDDTIPGVPSGPTDPAWIRFSHDLDDTVPVFPTTSAQTLVSSTPVIPWKAVNRGKKAPFLPRHVPVLPTQNKFSSLSIPSPSAAPPASRGLRPSPAGQKKDRHQLLKTAVGRRSGGLTQTLPQNQLHCSPQPPVERQPPPSSPPIVVNTAQTNSSITVNTVPSIAPSTPSPAVISNTNSTKTVNKKVPPLIPPTVLVVGDSIIKHLRFPNAITHCLPGATIPVLLNKLPGLLVTIPESIEKIVVHIGTNDTSHCNSELLKSDFMRLVDYLHTTKIAFFLSGPISRHDSGDIGFSRVVSINSWLKRLCRNHDIPFIDNFNLFWNRSSFFNRDRLHPNKWGIQALASNFIAGIRNYSNTALPFDMDGQFPDVLTGRETETDGQLPGNTSGRK